MSTDFAALDALYPLPAEELSRQWVLTRSEESIPSGWSQDSLNGWHLGAHPDAHVCTLLAEDGSPIGWVIEPLVYLGPAGDVVPEGSLTLPIGAHATAAEVEQALYGRDEKGRSSGDGLMGTWTAVVFGGPADAPFQRIYLSATHSVVFSPERRTVATTHNLVEGLRRNEALSRAFDCLSRNAYFTFGFTAFEGLHRLLPNHYLDLDTFVPVRHWPPGALEPLDTGEEGAAAMVEHARRLMRPLTTRYDRFIVYLSAGRDSRAMLATMRPFIDEGVDLRLSTSYGRSFKSRVDAQAARRLARIVELPHAVKRRRPHDPQAGDVLRAFARVGEASADSSLSKAGVTKSNLYDPTFKIGGMGGGLGRAFWWSGRYQLEQAEDEVSSEALLQRTKSPETDAIIEAAEAWLSGLPDGVRSSGPDTLDLAYVEQRLGCWQAPMTYLFPGTRHVSNPMIETFPIEIMLRLPESYRAAKRIQRDMVAYGWPELLVVPFNKPTHSLRVWQSVRRLPRRLRRISRRLA